MVERKLIKISRSVGLTIPDPIRKHMCLERGLVYTAKQINDKEIVITIQTDRPPKETQKYERQKPSGDGLYDTVTCEVCNSTVRPGTCPVCEHPTDFELND